MKDTSRTGIRVRLNILILLIVIPAWLLVFYIAIEQRRVETDSIQRRVLILAQAAAGVEDQQLAATRHLLAAIADYSVLSGEKTKISDTFFSDLLKKSSVYEDLGMLTPDGRLIVHGQTAPAVNFNAQPWFRRAIRIRRFSMDNAFTRRINGAQIRYVALPVIGGGDRVRAVVFAALNLDRMNRSIYKMLDDLPPGATVKQIDETGSVITYLPREKTWVNSQRFGPGMMKRILRRKSGVIDISGKGSTAQIMGFAPVNSAYMKHRAYICLAIPKKVAFATSNRMLIRNLILLGLVVILALITVWWASDLIILRRIRAIEQASQKLAAGELGVRIGLLGGSDEFGHLVRTFDEMAAALEMRQSKELKDKEELRQSREKLRNLAAYLQGVREEEATRIAREIHDNFGQYLTILKMDLSWLKKRVADDSQPLVEKIESMSSTIDRSLEVLHTITSELRPVILDDFGLPAALEWQAGEFEKRTGIPCRFDSKLGEIDLDKEKSIALFRIFQEILTNIIRHANATRVEVRLDRTDAELVLAVADDGCGITPEQINDSRSYGLIGIKERLYPWNGSVQFTGSPGEGTHVTVRFPLVNNGAPL